MGISFLAHASDINDLLEGLDGVLENGLDGLHDSLLSISLIWGCMPSMAFIFLATSTRGCPSSSLLRILAVRAFWMFLMAAVLATAASESPLASEERAEERVDSRLTRRSSSFMESYLLAAAMARIAANFIVILIIPM